MRGSPNKIALPACAETAHGFLAPEIDPGAVQFLVETPRGLLAETLSAKQPA